MTKQRRSIEAHVEEEPTRKEQVPVSGAAPAAHREADATSQEAGEEVPTLYERLQRSGALGEVMEAAAREESASGQPEDEDARVTLTRAPRTVSEVVAKPSASAGETFVVEDSGSVEITDDFFAVPGEEDIVTEVPLRDASSSADPTVPVLTEASDAAPRHSLTPQSASLSRERPGVSRGVLVALVLLLGVSLGGVGTWLASRLDGTSDRTYSERASRASRASREEAVSPSVVSSVPVPGPAEVSEGTSEPQPEAVEPAPEAASPADSRTDREAAEARRAAAEARRAARRRAREEQAAAEAQEPADVDEPARTPPRAEIIAVMQAITPELARCAGDTHGLARLTMTVSGRGRVQHVLVGGDYDGTSEGSCIAQAARSAQFPSFEQASMKLTYPIRL